MPQHTPAPTSLLSRPTALLTSALMLTIGLVAFEGLSVAAALPAVGGDLGAADRLPWVMTAYLLASGLAIALSGPLVDAVGARAVFRFATVGFALASIACGLSASLGLLVAARMVQGVAGGTIIATTGAAIGLGYPVSLRSRAYAMAATVWGVLAFGGPALAAFLLTVLSWRWIFLVNAPLALAAATVGWMAIPGLVGARGKVEVDFKGALLVGGFSGIALVGLSGASWSTLGALLVAVALAIAYWRHSDLGGGCLEGENSKVRREPILKRRHFAEQPFRSLALTAGLVMASGVGVETFLPLYLRGARGASVAVAAWSVLFLTVGWTASANVVSRLYHRFQEGLVAFSGAVLMLPALMFGALAVSLSLPLPWLFAAFFLLGVGIGTTTNACLTLVQHRATEQEIGRATAAHQFVRNLSVTFGTAAAGAILLLASSLQSGDEQALQGILAGGSAQNALAQNALGMGFVSAHAVALVLGILATFNAWPLVRRRTSVPQCGGIIGRCSAMDAIVATDRI